MKKLRAFAVGLAVILFVTAAAALAKNVQLKTKHDRELAGMESRVMVPIGTVVPSFRAFNRFDGSNETKITTPTILAVFSPTCAACEANWSNWEAIQSEADKRGIRLLFVNLSSQMAPDGLRLDALDARFPVRARS